MKIQECPAISGRGIPSERNDMKETATALAYIDIPDFQTYGGKQQPIQLSYEVFGQPLHQAPVVLVNHALTGNSHVAGESGWWSDLVGEGKCIDTRRYAVLAFNIPGNGYDGFAIENYRDFIARDIAQVFLTGLEKLGITRLYAAIGGSLGGGIAWEMAALNPNLIDHLIPIVRSRSSSC